MHISLGSAALRIQKSQASLSLGFGCDQIGQCFRLKQVDFAVEERASGKLARLGGPNSGDTYKFIQKRSNDSLPAMNMKFRVVLASEAMGTWKE